MEVTHTHTKAGLLDALAMCGLGRCLRHRNPDEHRTRHNVKVPLRQAEAILYPRLLKLRFLKLARVRILWSPLRFRI